MSKFCEGDRVLVTDAGREIEDEPATVEDVENGVGGEYWCVFDQGRKTERESAVGVPFEEKRLDPGWFDEEQLISVK